MGGNEFVRIGGRSESGGLNVGGDVQLQISLAEGVSEERNASQKEGERRVERPVDFNRL